MIWLCSYHPNLGICTRASSAGSFQLIVWYFRKEITSKNEVSVFSIIDGDRSLNSFMPGGCCLDQKWMGGFEVGPFKDVGLTMARVLICILDVTCNNKDSVNHWTICCYTWPYSWFVGIDGKTDAPWNQVCQGQLYEVWLKIWQGTVLHPRDTYLSCMQRHKWLLGRARWKMMEGRVGTLSCWRYWCMMIL